MKLLKEEFENYAQEQGYESAEELFDYLGGNVNAYRRYKKQVPISKETFTQICWEVASFAIIFSHSEGCLFTLLIVWIYHFLKPVLCFWRDFSRCIALTPLLVIS